MKTEEKIEIAMRIKRVLTRASFDYYIMADPSISDGKFDELERTYNDMVKDLGLGFKFVRGSCYTLNNPYLDKKRREILRSYHI